MLLLNFCMRELMMECCYNVRLLCFLGNFPCILALQARPTTVVQENIFKVRWFREHSSPILTSLIKKLFISRCTIALSNKNFNIVGLLQSASQLKMNQIRTSLVLNWQNHQQRHYNKHNSILCIKSIGSYNSKLTLECGIA